MNTADAAEQIVKMTLNGAETVLRISGRSAERIAVLIKQLSKELKDNQKNSKGLVRLRNLAKEGHSLEVFECAEGKVKEFGKLAKKYGVMYTIIKDKENKESVVILARTEEKQRVNHIFKRMQTMPNITSSVEITNEKHMNDKINNENKEIQSNKERKDFIDDLWDGKNTNKRNPSNARTSDPLSAHILERKKYTSKDTEERTLETGRPSVKAKLIKYEEIINGKNTKAKSKSQEFKKHKNNRKKRRPRGEIR